MRARRPMFATRGAITGLLLCVSACASTPDVDVADAATQPLKDFNLRRPDIPDVLERAMASPYWPAPTTCAALAKDIAELDKALGADLDVEPVKDVDETGELLEDTLRDAASGWIPFRSVIRRMTGAEARDREVEAAGIAGAIRRGYLKGYGERMGCTPPAAPVRPPPTQAPASTVPPAK